MSSAQKAVIIGGGIGGLAAAAILARAGYEVALYEQLDSLGGKARQFRAEGFTFDMGPSWYLMPEVFAHFFELFNEDVGDFVRLKRLEPAYKVFYEKHAAMTMSGGPASDARIFESIERGAGQAFLEYLNNAEQTYKVAKSSFLYTNFSNKRLTFKSALNSSPNMLPLAYRSIDKLARSTVEDARLRQILEFPALFLGTPPKQTPALYHLLSHSLASGVFYPEGGMYGMVEAIKNLAIKHGAKLHTGTPVKNIVIEEGQAKGINLQDGSIVAADLVISNTDRHFTETSLLPAAARSFKPSYWQRRSLGPSGLLFYLGVRGRLPQLEHHNLFFAADWQANFKAIFEDKSWPDKASFYACKPSVSDPSVAPEGHENVFLFVPLPCRIMDPQEIKTLSMRYLQQFGVAIDQPDLIQRIVYKRLFTPNDFASEYNAWSGSALGLNHRLKQSAFYRPDNRSKKVPNLYFVGADTMPGIGLPMCLISAELLYKRLQHDTSTLPLARL